MNRRRFISATSGALLAVVQGMSRGAGRAPRPLRILILGGTQFLGIHVTQLAPRAAIP